MPYLLYTLHCSNNLPIISIVNKKIRKIQGALNRLIGKIYDGISKLAISDHVARLFPRGKISFRRGTFRRNRSYKLCAPRAVIRIQSREKETEEHVDAFTLPGFPPLDEKSKSNSSGMSFLLETESSSNTRYKIRIWHFSSILPFNWLPQWSMKGTCYKRK